MTYLNHFARGERHLSSDELKDYTETIRIIPSNPDDIKLLNLYRDCFSPHVTDYFGAPRDAIKISKQNDRIVAADNLTHVFLHSYYNAPDVFQSASSKPKEDSRLTFKEFRERITTNPIDATSNSNFDLGTNKVSYLIGDVGVGKSTFISRLIMDFVDVMPVDEDGFWVVPILYDFEIRHKEGSKLKDINDSFWADLYSLIYQTISSNTKLNNQSMLDEIAINPKSPDGGFHRELIHHLRQLFHHLANRKIRLILIFDNLDRYHFHYTKYSFFEDYADEQFTSVKSNIAVLVNMFDKKDLWKSGLCVLFACRRYLYDYLSNFDGATPKDNHFGVFQLSRASAGAVVASRLNLFEAAVKVVHPVVSATKSDNFKDYLSQLKGLLVIENTAAVFRQIESPVLEALARIGHNGYRSLVKFLASLSLQYNNSDAIERLLVKQPHLLILLYIANNHQRYSQDQSHFPNLFLNDCVVSSDREFLQVHKTHEHTYWLKYFILKYLLVGEKENDFHTTEDIHQLFSGSGRYEEHLVNLALGSLCTTGEFSCIEINYSTSNSVKDCRLTLTERGKYLVGHDSKLFSTTKPIDFCFNFHYLQLIIDDKLLAIPKQWYKKIFSNFQYGYLYLPDAGHGGGYGDAAYRVVSSKIEATLYFLKILEASLEFEKCLKKNLFEELAEKSILPSFNAINLEFLSTAEKLLTVFRHQEKIKPIIDLEKELRYDNKFDDFFSSLDETSRLVRK